MVRLEQEITEIHAVFMDLATMVSARGDELNRMEDHVNGAITSFSQVVLCSMLIFIVIGTYMLKI